VSDAPTGPVEETSDDDPADVVSSSPYELFIVALSLLSLINIVLLALPVKQGTKNIVLVVDGVMCLIFLADFTQRFVRARPRSEYFWRGLGWLDLLGSLPLPGFRVFRIARVAHVTRRLHARGGRRMIREINQGRAESAFLFVVFLVIVTVEVASIAVLSVESRTRGANIDTASDALWWSMETISTVGYGDVYPVNNAGRVVGVILMVIGVGLFGTFTAFVANVFLSPRARKEPTPESDIADLRRLLADNERVAAELRARVDRLDANLRAARGPEPP
jgi:voltage-gated potassium channel